MTDRRVVITGLGVVAPHGSDLDGFVDAIFAGQSAVRIVRRRTEAGEFEVAGASVEYEPWKSLPRGLIGASDRSGLFALVAVENALADAGLDLSIEDRTRVGVSIGTSLGGALSQESAYAQLFRDPESRLSPFTLVRVMYNGPAAHIGLRYKLSGPNLTHTNTCSSSTVAIGEAWEKIRHGHAEVMLAGGTEALFAFVSIKAWSALQVLAAPRYDSPESTCRPFSKDRTGTVLGEGAAFLVLEERVRAMQRGARIYAELAGYAVQNDCSHMTQPSVEAQRSTMAAALKSAALEPDAVDYINAHGTGTLLNDRSESSAIKQLFADYQCPAVSSTKSMHGHLVGAAGAVEALITATSIYRQVLPPTANLFNPDPDLGLDFVPFKGRSATIRSALSNSFAVGGTASTLAITRHFPN